jgi:hypothetical protein
MKTPGEMRNTLTCRIKESNRQWLLSEKERAGKGIGELVDLAVEVLQKHPEELPPDAEMEENEESEP